MSKLRFTCYENERIKKYLSAYKTNNIHPFYGYEGNAAAVETGMDIIYSAYQTRDTYSKGEFNDRRCTARIALIAPMSSGKTEYFRRFSKLLGTPSLEIDGTKLSNAEEIQSLCWQAWKNNPQVIEYGHTEWKEIKTNNGVKRFEVPPMCILIDEFGRVKPAVQDGLLKMTENKDGMLVCDGIEYDFRGVCIIIATNNSGKIRPALKSRFTMITLERPDINALTNIIKNENSDWELKDCFRIAQLCPVARQALDFARLVKSARERISANIADAIEQVRMRHGIYKVGLTRRAAQLLQSLSGSKDGLSRVSILASMDNMEEEEFDKDILPQLIPGGGRPALISINNRHRITEAGEAALQACHEEMQGEAA